MNDNDVLLEALKWVTLRGASVVPLRYASKHPDNVALRSTGHTIDGRASWRQLQSEPPIWVLLASWFRPDRRHNLGVVTGYGGLVCLDFDSFDMFGLWDTWAKKQGGIAATVANTTYRVLTRRGVHVWIKVAEPVASFRGPLFDIKGAGGYVLVPPSLHPKGVRYTAFDDDAPVVECQRLADVFPFVPEAPRRTPAAAAPHPRACQAGNVPSAATVIERIKARLTCADLLGVDLAGREKVQVLCPLHDDHNMSAVVNARGRFFCSAGCTGDHGFDVIDLYGALYRLEFRDVLGKLARELNIDEYDE